MKGFTPVPKPGGKRKKPLYNGYKDKPERRCYYTGAPGAERHEVYGGPNRQASIKYGFQVDLSQEIHRRFHNPQTREDHDRIEFWQRKCQKGFEEKMIGKGFTERSARQFFMTIIGKNYLD